MPDLISRAAAAGLAAGLIALGAGVVTASAAAPAAAAPSDVTCPVIVSSGGGLSPPPAPGVDWSGCNLSGANLGGANLTGANLTGANLSSVGMQSANLTDATMAGATLTNSNLTSANLTDANLTGANLDAVTLTDTTLSGATLTAANLAQENSGGIVGTPSALPANWLLLDGTLFGPQAGVLGGSFPDINLSGADLAGAEIFETNLTGANLSGADLSGAALLSVTLTGADLSGTDLSGASLGGVKSGGVTGKPSALPASWSLISGYLIGPKANLGEAQLAGANLAGADLAGAGLGFADLAGASLSGANLTSSNVFSANLGSTDLSGATLTGIISGDVTGTPVGLPATWRLISGYLVGPGATLNRASLPGADLSGMDLSGTSFNVANLTGTDFTGANLTDAKFPGATLGGAKLAGATMSGVYGYDIIGTPASLPANWLLVSRVLVGPDANLSSDNLTGADLAGDDLTGADFTDADLADANLDGATVTPANFSDVIWSDTTCPDGTNSNIYLDGCFSAPDTIAPTASPSVYSGVPGAKGWYTSAVTVFWSWTDNVAVNPAGCTGFSNSTGNGKLTLTATCSDYAGNVGHASFQVDVDTTRPAVAVTGVRGGQQYLLGKVPAAGCASTDTVSGIATPASLALTTTGHNGVGSFTATCAGAVSVAGNRQAAPVSATYSVVYGFGGFRAPATHVRLHRGARSVAATFRLVTGTDAPISSARSQALARAGDVRVTLSGPRIKPVTASCRWQAGPRLFRCVINVPARIRNGRRYSITATENVGRGFLRVPAVGRARNPQAIYFS